MTPIHDPCMAHRAGVVSLKLCWWGMIDGFVVCGLRLRRGGFVMEVVLYICTLPCMCFPRSNIEANVPKS